MGITVFSASWYSELINTRVVAKVFGVLFALVNLTFMWVVGLGTGEKTLLPMLLRERNSWVSGPFLGRPAAFHGLMAWYFLPWAARGEQGVRNGRTFQERVRLHL